MYKVDTESQEVLITLVFIPHKDVPRDVVNDALEHLWDLNVGKEMRDAMGVIDQTQGPGFDSAVSIDVEYESVEEFLKNYKEDEIVFGKAFKVELELSMEKYFKQKLLMIIHGDLEEHVFITNSPEAEEELIVIENHLNEVELAWL
jgi:hypothetical protein